MTAQIDDAIRAALAPAREATFSRSEAARAIAAAERPARRPRRRVLALALSLAVLLTTTAAAIPATRDAVFGWLDRGDPPGRELRPDDDAPAWVREAAERRLVAENGGVELYAVREDAGIGFALDDAVGISDSVEGWRDQFDDHAVVVLGPGALNRQPSDARARRPLFGVTADSVTRVELRYARGPPHVANNLDGGFVLLADPAGRRGRSSPSTLKAVCWSAARSIFSCASVSTSGVAHPDACSRRRKVSMLGRPRAVRRCRRTTGRCQIASVCSEDVVPRSAATRGRLGGGVLRHDHGGAQDRREPAQPLGVLPKRATVE